jgi:hypothetical protein
VLWHAADPSTSATSATPSNLPFSLELTSDLPHCIHSAPYSALEYTLTAYCFLSGRPDTPISFTTPVHMTRYSSESSACCSKAGMPEHSSETCTNGPSTTETSHPTRITMVLQKTAFRRTEPIPVRVQIQPPTSSLVEEKGLQLRSVSLELVRTTTSLLLDQSYTSVLCRSGKSARFSPARPLNLYLAVPPRLDEDLSCESITQSTILHSLSFALRLTVAVSSREMSDRQDIVLEKAVVILPDLPRVTSRKSEKQKEAEAHLTWDYRGAAPTYSESLGGSSSEGASPASGEWDAEEEYDGFEESVSAEADAMVHAAPSIDADVSPPSLSPDAPHLITTALASDEGDFLLQAGYVHAADVAAVSGHPLFPVASRTSTDEESDLSASTMASSRESSHPAGGAADHADEPPSYTQNSLGTSLGSFARPPPYRF